MEEEGVHHGGRLVHHLLLQGLVAHAEVLQTHMTEAAQGLPRLATLPHDTCKVNGIFWSDIFNMVFLFFVEKWFLLPTGTEEREVLGVGSIPVAILPSCQDMHMETIALELHNHEYS